MSCQDWLDRELARLNAKADAADKQERRFTILGGLGSVLAAAGCVALLAHGVGHVGTGAFVVGYVVSFLCFLRADRARGLARACTARINGLLDAAAFFEDGDPDDSGERQAVAS